jgi:hypothetical protein
MYVGVQVTDGVLHCAVPAAALISGAAMLATGVTNTFGAAVLAAGGTFGVAALFELLPTMLGIGGRPNSTCHFPTPKRLNNGRDEGGHLFLNLFFDKLWNLCHFLPKFLKLAAFIRIE